jgi:hypothetical protein
MEGLAAFPAVAPAVAVVGIEAVVGIVIEEACTPAAGGCAEICVLPAVPLAAVVGFDVWDACERADNSKLASVMLKLVSAEGCWFIRAPLRFM